MGILLLTWRYVCYQKIKTVILVTCLAITFFLPLAVSLLTAYYERDLDARADATPMVLGAKGNRYDLTLKSLYFTAESPDPINLRDVEQLRESNKAMVIPLHIEFTAGKFNSPVVGTDLEYFDFRGLTCADGTLPLRLGDVVVGAQVAATLGIGKGARLLTNQRNLYDIGSTYPLKMRVTGVLARSGTPDDRAVFVDVKTAWVIAGIGHGHTDLAATTNPLDVLKREQGHVVGSPAVVEYMEITEANLASFHFHGGGEHFPLTSAIVVPGSDKSAAILKGRIGKSKTLQLLEPPDVIDELMGIVFQIKRFFNANFVLISVVTVLFLALVVMLSLKIRASEMETMFKIGCGRGTMFLLQCTELGMVIILSVAVAAVLAMILLWSAPQVSHLV